MHFPHQLRYGGRQDAAHHGPHECAVERQVSFRHPGRGGEAALVGGVVAAERADVVERPPLAAHDPVAGDEVGVGCLAGFGLEHRLVKARRQHVDHVDIARELAVLLARHAGGDENSEMSDGFVDRVDDRLAVGADLVDVLVEIEDPSERLLRRRDVVALRAEHHDRRADAAEIDRASVGKLDPTGREVVADEELVDDELDLFRVEIDVAAPPALEAEIARGFGVDLGIEIILLAPQRVGRVEALEILHQPGAVELAMAEIAGQRREPAAAQQAAAVAHRILAMHARPVGHRRSGDDDRTEELGPHRGQDHHGPACLAVADHAGLAVGLGVQRDHALQEDRLGTGDVLDGLPGHGIRQEADEVAGMPRLERDADLAVGLEAADPRPMSRARIHHHEGTPRRIDRDPLGRHDASQGVIDGPVELPAVHHQLDRVVEHVRRGLCQMLAVLIAALAHDVPEKDIALGGIDHVLDRGSYRA